MPQTFIVLRNDQQMGPYTIDQLKTVGLRPDDMVWVEGQSAAWQRAAAVPQLKGFSFAETVASSNIIATDPEEEPIYFPQTNRQQKTSASTWIVIVAVVLLLGGGAWMILKPSSAKAVATQTTIESTTTDTSSLIAATGDSLNLPTAEGSESSNNAVVVEQPTTVKTTTETVPTNKAEPNEAVSTDETTTDVPQVTTTSTEPVTETKPEPQTEQPTAPTTEPAPKKKTALEKIDDWVQNNEILGPQKKTVERDVTDAVQVRLRTSSDEFLLGVRGGQVVLQNNSGMKLRSAKTEVVYYDEKGQVLDRKTVSFGAVAAGATVTAAAPDHRTAERAEVTLVSATGLSKE